MPNVIPSGVPDEYRMTLPPSDSDMGQIERSFNTLPFVRTERATPSTSQDYVATTGFINATTYVVGGARPEGGTFARTGYTGIFDYQTNTTVKSPAFTVKVERLTTYHLTGRLGIFIPTNIDNYGELVLNVWRDNTLWECHSLGLVGAETPTVISVPVSSAGTLTPGYQYHFDLDGRKASGVGTMDLQMVNGWAAAPAPAIDPPTLGRTSLTLLTW